MIDKCVGAQGNPPKGALSPEGRRLVEELIGDGGKDLDRKALLAELAGTKGGSDLSNGASCAKLVSANN